MIFKELQKDDLYELYQKVELPLASVLARMEKRGILVDPERLEEISADLDETLTRLTDSIHTQAGEKFNINSPKQLGVILFKRWAFPS